MIGFTIQVKDSEGKYITVSIKDTSHPMSDNDIIHFEFMLEKFYSQAWGCEVDVQTILDDDFYDDNEYPVEF